jgi:hypothetical protein
MAAESGARSGGLAGAIYGTLLATAVVAALSEDPAADPIEIVETLALTAVVFALAHAYASLLAGGAAGQHQIGRGEIRAAIADEVPLIVSFLPLVAALLLAPLGVLSEGAAESAAFVTGLVILAAAGSAIGWRQRAGVVGAVATGTLSAMLGLAIVALKAIVH